MAKCAVRLDATSGQYVPLLTRSGTEIGRKIMPPPSLRPGEQLTPAKMELYRSYYVGQAKNYQALLARELEQEAFTHFAPATIANIAYEAFAGHESGTNVYLIGTEEDRQNHMAFIECNPTYQQAMRMGLKGTVILNTEATNDILCEEMGKAIDYISGRPELAADMAHLCAYQAFSLMDRMNQHNGFEKIMERFNHHGVKGTAFIQEIMDRGGTIADLGMGSSALFYMFFLQNGPVTYMADISEFNVALHQRFAELIAKTDTYLARVEDITGSCSQTAIPHNSISHAIVRGVLHHIDSSLFPRFSDYLFHILSSQGTFTIMDGFKDNEMIEYLLGLLKSRGFTATIDPETRKTESEENRILFEIEGQKQI